MLAIIGPFSSGEVKCVFPVGDRLGIVSMSMASSTPHLAEPPSTTPSQHLGRRLHVRAGDEDDRRQEIPHADRDVAYATDDTISKVLGDDAPAGRHETGRRRDQGQVTFNLAAFDFSPQVTQLAQNPTDLVAIGATPEPAIKLVAEMRRQGVKARVVAASTLALPDLPRKMGAGGDGTVIPTTFFAGLDARTRAFAASLSAARQGAS